MSRSVIVLGQHRSGTSAIAGILHHLGIPMGTPGVVESATHTVDGWPAFDSNKHGQFEDDDFVKIFDDGHGAWACPIWWVIPPKTMQATKELVEKREEKHELWGLKSPQLCYTLTYLLDYLEDPVVIAIQRDFYDMTASLAKRDDLPLPVAQHIQSLYYSLFTSSVTEVKGRDVPLLELRFEEVLRNPMSTVQQIIAFIAKPINVAFFLRATNSIARARV